MLCNSFDNFFDYSMFVTFSESAIKHGGAV